MAHHVHLALCTLPNLVYQLQLSRRYNVCNVHHLLLLGSCLAAAAAAAATRLPHAPAAATRLAVAVSVAAAAASAAITCRCAAAVARRARLHGGGLWGGGHARVLLQHALRLLQPVLLLQQLLQVCRREVLVRRRCN